MEEAGGRNISIFGDNFGPSDERGSILIEGDQIDKGFIEKWDDNKIDLKLPDSQVFKENPMITVVTNEGIDASKRYLAKYQFLLLPLLHQVKIPRLLLRLPLSIMARYQFLLRLHNQGKIPRLLLRLPNLCQRLISHESP